MLQGRQNIFLRTLQKFNEGKMDPIQDAIISEIPSDCCKEMVLFKIKLASIHSSMLLILNQF